MAGSRNLALGFVLGAIVAAAGIFAYASMQDETQPTAVQSAPADKSSTRGFASLPDWTGIWMGTGGNLFDQSKGAANVNANRNARDYPPYRPEWEAAYKQFLDTVVSQGKFVDPLTVGYPGGMMRMMTPARGLQFILRPEQVWIVYERPDVRYIYTDGRPFPPPVTSRMASVRSNAAPRAVATRARTRRARLARGGGLAGRPVAVDRVLTGRGPEAHLSPVGFVQRAPGRRNTRRTSLVTRVLSARRSGLVALPDN